MACSVAKLAKLMFSVVDLGDMRKVSVVLGSSGVGSGGFRKSLGGMGVRTTSTRGSANLAIAVWSWCWRGWGWGSLDRCHGVSRVTWGGLRDNCMSINLGGSGEWTGVTRCVRGSASCGPSHIMRDPWSKDVCLLPWVFSHCSFLAGPLPEGMLQVTIDIIWGHHLVFSLLRSQPPATV